MTQCGTRVVCCGVRAGSVGFKLLVRSAKPLKRDDIDSVSKLLAQDIETYGPLEISGREVTLSKAPEIVPSERKSALGKRIVV